jgi:hypothetical protein
MKICSYRSIVLAVLTRNEHCPPHVHAGTPEWEARFEFSFWHNGVRLWDVVPLQNRPSAALLEGLRTSLMKPAHLHKARTCWWQSTGAACLIRQRWDAVSETVVSGNRADSAARMIQAASFDATARKTVLTLKGSATPVEIML